MCATTAGLFAWALLERDGRRILPTSREALEPLQPLEPLEPLEPVQPPEPVTTAPGAFAAQPMAPPAEEDVEARVRERLYGSHARRR